MRHIEPAAVFFVSQYPWTVYHNDTATAMTAEDTLLTEPSRADNIHAITNPPASPHIRLSIYEKLFRFLKDENFFH